MSNKYLSLVHVTLRDVDTCEFVGEAGVLVLTDTPDVMSIGAVATDRFDHYHPMTRLQSQLVHEPRIVRTVELPFVNGDMSDKLWGELYNLVDDCEGSQDVLDCLVHDVYSKKASDLNNEGTELQLDALVDELGPQGLGEELCTRLNAQED